MQTPTCPTCREPTTLPQRNFSLRDIISWFFTIRGQEEPTTASQGVDHERFKAAYEGAHAREERREIERMEREVIEQWEARRREQGGRDGEMVVIDDDEDEVMTEVEGSSEWEGDTEHGENLDEVEVF
jgi:hypothetical protein